MLAGVIIGFREKATTLEPGENARFDVDGDGLEVAVRGVRQVVKARPDGRGSLMLLAFSVKKVRPLIAIGIADGRVGVGALLATECATT